MLDKYAPVGTKDCESQCERKVVMTPDFEKDYIMCVKFFKTKQESSAYVYLEGFYDSNGIYNEVNQETIMSREFISANSEEVGGKLLVDITKKFNRDKKIDLILE